MVDLESFFGGFGFLGVYAFDGVDVGLFFFDDGVGNEWKVGFVELGEVNLEGLWGGFCYGFEVFVTDLADVDIGLLDATCELDGVDDPYG